MPLSDIGCHFIEKAIFGDLVPIRLFKAAATAATYNRVSGLVGFLFVRRRIRRCSQNLSEPQVRTAFVSSVHEDERLPPIAISTKPPGRSLMRAIMLPCHLPIGAIHRRDALRGNCQL